MKKTDLSGMMRHLTDLYYAQPEQVLSQGGNTEYTQALTKARRDVFYSFPGMTVLFAEIADHDYPHAMMHVLAPIAEDVEQQLGWHDTHTAILSLADGVTALWDVTYLEVKKDDVWYAGTVLSIINGFGIAVSGGEIVRLLHGDVVRNVRFKESEQ